MSEDTESGKSKSTTTVRNVIRIVIVVAVMLTSDLILVNWWLPAREAKDALKTILLIEGGILLFVGAMSAGGGSASSRDVTDTLRYHARTGIPLSPETRDEYVYKKKGKGQLIIAAVLMIIGAILMVSAFVPW